MTEDIEVIFEDAGLVVVNKPAGLVCHPTKAGPRSSLVGRLRLRFGPEAEVHLLNRLDRETSGVTLVGLDREVARAIRAAWAAGRVLKEYWAVVHGHVLPDEFTVRLSLGKDLASPVAIKDCARPDGAAAETRVQVIRRFARREGLFTWVRVYPQTGRKHQIRIHLAAAGHPIVGDKIYGGDEQIYLRFVQGALTAADQSRLILAHHALHARALTLEWNCGRSHFVAHPAPRFAALTDGMEVDDWPKNDLSIGSFE